MSPKLPKLTAFLLILVLAVPMFLAPAASAPTALAAQAGDITTADDAVASKIHPKLQAAVAAAAYTDGFDVVVYAKAGADLSSYMSDVLAAKYVWPHGTQTYYGRIRAGNVAKLASLPSVAAIQDMRYQGDRPQLPDMGEKRLNAYDPSTARAMIAGLKARKGTAAPNPPSDPVKAADWFDILDVHKSKAAWDLGYTGDGVKVLVNDTGSDFSHPDLMGTVARIDDPASPYNGWPEMFDSFSMLNLAYDYYLGTDYVKSGVGIFGNAPDYADTSTTRSGDQLVPGGDGTYSAVFAPVHSIEAAGHIYKLPGTSKSGVYHFGSHPDTTLEAFFDERSAVIVVDENAAGVYDTVYVDLDADYDFTNNRKSVKGDEYVYMDLDGDGYADISGGIIYWVSDGVNSLPASDWLWGFGPEVAGPGDLVAFSIDDYAESGDHGTLCASGVAGQGVIDGGSPAYKPAGDGTPGTGISVGGGKNVKLSSNGDGYTTSEAFIEGVLFSALGYDGAPNTADDMQIVSDSWGSSATVNDGWDYDSRLFDVVLRFVNPYLSEGNSTGNGGAGYGTTNSPGANLSISVGASTLYDSDGVTFDSVVSKDQFLYNDSMSFSDRGPSAQGEVGVSVMANGAWGAGNIPLNEALAAGVDGWNAWENWGGTSRSTPVAMGNLALALQAYQQKNGRWPTNVEARAILMSGADTAWNDGFVEGAGTVNALRSVQIAAGTGGVTVTPDSLTFGDYRGTKYDAFTSIMFPGKTKTETFSVSNPSAAPVNLSISDDQFVRFAEKTIDLTTVDQTLETANFRLPDYLIDIENLIPAGTQMMEAILVQPFMEFDPNLDYNANSSWRVVPTDWTDVNGDGKLFEDKNGNGAINCPIVGANPDWSAEACEIQGGEYMRFGYGYDRGTTSQQRVKLPLERKHDGIFVALSHRSKSTTVPVTHLKVQLNFYKTQDMPWLTTPATLMVPAGGTATFDAIMSVPATANIGLYEATIRVSDGTHQTNVPVVANVAAFSTDFLLGGPPETKTPYENGMVSGYFDWTNRAESGDWRFFFMDAPDTTPAGTYLLIDNRWSGAKTDIDTIVMGPTQDCFSNGVGCTFPISSFPGFEPTYGPYTLAAVGGSDRLNPRAGVWLQQTSTGGPREMVTAPVKPGLNLVALHNNMLDGDKWAETFQAQVGTMNATPNSVDMFADSKTSGSFPISVKSSLPLADLQVAAFGLGVPDIRTLPQIQDNPDDPSTASYRFPITATDAAYIEVTTEAAAGDIDLFLLYDRNNDGNFDFGSEVLASSTTSSGNEHVKVTFPADGNYLAAVHGWGIQPGATFTINMNVVQGTDLQVVDLSEGPYQPNTPISFNVNWSLKAPLGENGEAFGVVLLGPTGAESAIEIPVRLHDVIGSRETISVSAHADTRLFSGAANTNYGQEKYLWVGANDTSRSVLRFDLGGINPESGVESAKLRVYVDALGGGGSPADLAAYQLTTDFVENTATWNTPWAMKGGDYMAGPVSAPISSADVGKFVEVDVTPWAQSWFSSPSTNHGVLLKLDNPTSFTYYRLSSGEYWDPAKMPTLVVTVTKP